MATIATIAAAGMMDHVPTDKKLLDLNRNENDAPTSDNGGEVKMRRNLLILLAQERGEVKVLRENGKGIGQKDKKPTNKERRKAIEFEDLILEFDEILEDNASNKYCEEKTGGQGRERMDSCHVNAFIFYMILNCTIQLLGAWLAWCIVTRWKSMNSYCIGTGIQKMLRRRIRTWECIL